MPLTVLEPGREERYDFHVDCVTRLSKRPKKKCLSDRVDEFFWEIRVLRLVVVIFLFFFQKRRYKSTRTRSFFFLRTRDNANKRKIAAALIRLLVSRKSQKKKIRNQNENRKKKNKQTHTRCGVYRATGWERANAKYVRATTLSKRNTADKRNIARTYSACVCILSVFRRGYSFSALAMFLFLFFFFF